MQDNVPQSDLDHYILGEMYLRAAKGVQLQCQREYWTGENDEPVRATSLHRLSIEQRKNLPTNNLNAERYLAKFGYLAAQSAQHSNRLFKAKRIKDDLMLMGKDTDVERSTIAVLKHLDTMEIIWCTNQKEKKKQRLKDNLKKKMRANNFVDQLLVKCKEHNGPITTIDELKDLVRHQPPELKTCLRQELQYQRVTHQRDADVRKDLYKVNKTSVHEMIENLTIILGSDEHQSEGAVVFPCEEEIMETLEVAIITNVPDVDEVLQSHFQDEPLFHPNQPLAVLWDEGNSKVWYVGFYMSNNGDGTFRVDHLMRSTSGDDR